MELSGVCHSIERVEFIDEVTSSGQVNAVNIFDVGAGQICSGAGNIEIVAIIDGVDAKNERISGSFAKQLCDGML